MFLMNYWSKQGLVCVHSYLFVWIPQTLFWEILDTYMIGLDIQMMQAGEHKLLIQLDMEELSSKWTVNYLWVY